MKIQSEFTLPKIRGVTVFKLANNQPFRMAPQPTVSAVPWASKHKAEDEKEELQEEHVQTVDKLEDLPETPTAAVQLYTVGKHSPRP